MSTLTAPSPSDRGGAPSLPEGVFEEAFDGPGDPRRNPALLELIKQVVPYAMDLIRAAFDEASPRRTRAPTTGQMRELVQAQHVPLPDDDPGEDDPEVRAEIARRTEQAIERATEAALLSAAMSLHSHWSREFAGVRTLDDLALNLIRIAYNRYQRRRRGDHRLARQAGSGDGARAAGGFLDSRPDRREGPASEAGLHEFLRIQRQLADGILEGFAARDRRIILLAQAGFEAEEIVQLVNRLRRGRQTCTRNTVNHVVAIFKAQVGRLEDEPDAEGPPGPQGDSDDGRDARPRGPDGLDPQPPDDPLPG